MAQRAELVFAGADERDLTKLDEYVSVGGYASLEKARTMNREELLQQLLDSGLRGRGGAGFPMGRKASFVPTPEQARKPVYLVVNADESEPGSFKDREIMGRVPHRLLEGCLIAAHAIEANEVFVYIRGEYLSEFEIVRDALAEAVHADLPGDVTIVLHRGAGAYICGEETALLESLEGKRGQPRAKPPFPAVSGVYASPTLINNVETIATVPKIVELGGAEYANFGVENSAGTRVFSLSGNVVNGGNYELPMGFSLRELIYDIGGGIADGHKLKAVIPGGLSTPVLTSDEIDVGLDFDSLAAKGTAVGSAGVMVLDDRACMVQAGLRATEFYKHESCGKCTPCREGTRWMVQLLEKLEAGDATQYELDLLLDVCDRINGTCLCPLGDSAAIVVTSYASKFRDEFQAHLDRGGCPLGGASWLADVLAPSELHDQHLREETHA
jgi:NADH-quinone oxidoreductase subunit F